MPIWCRCCCYCCYHRLEGCLEIYGAKVADTGESSINGANIANFSFSHLQTGNIAWVLISTSLVLLMIPGVGFFYSGLARRKSALSLIWLSIMSMAVVSFQVWKFSSRLCDLLYPLVSVS